MKKTIYLIITVFLFFSCNSLEIREEKFNNGNPKIKYEVSELEDGSFQKNGFYKEWFEKGQIKITGNYNKNLKDGEWNVFMQQIFHCHIVGSSVFLH